MGSALNGVMGGGGGGGIGSLVGGIVGGIFGGPLGAMLGQAIGGMVDQAAGDATKQAVDTLQKEDGMPKFLADEVKAKVDEILKELGQGKEPVDQQTQDAAKAQYGDAFKSFADSLAQGIIDKVREEMKNGGQDSEGERTGGTKGGSGKSGASSSSSGGSWLVAIAKAMGQALGDRAKKMVELSDKIAANKGGDSTESKQDAAMEAQKLSTEFQATSQEFQMLQQSFSTTIKALGEGMASMARKQ